MPTQLSGVYTKIRTGSTAGQVYIMGSVENSSCISEVWIYSGTLIDMGDDWITIQEAFNPAFGDSQVSYGSTPGDDPSFCCFLCSLEVLVGVVNTTLWITCDGVIVPSGSGVGSDIMRTDWRSTTPGSGIIKLTFNVDNSCFE